MADLLQDIAEYLDYQEVKNEEGIFLDFTPDEPDSVVVLYEYEGSATTPGTEGVVRRFQVTVRSEADKPDDARQKAWEVFNTLDRLDKVFDLREVDDEEFESQRWGVLSALQTPHKIKVDENGRTIYGFNMTMVTHRD